MKRPHICGVVTEHDEAAIRAAAPLVDLFELRLDLVGPRWPETARLLTRPWIATNRLANEGGRWAGLEADRTAELQRAVELEASIVDLELATSGLGRVIPLIKQRAECLISYHNMKATPPLEELIEIVRAELEAGADICKVATTARDFDDNTAILELIRAFPGTRLVALAMGEAGQASRILSPLIGAEFAYAALNEGAGSAPGQLTVIQLVKLYGELDL